MARDQHLTQLSRRVWVCEAIKNVLDNTVLAKGIVVNALVTLDIIMWGPGSIIINTPSGNADTAATTGEIVLTMPHLNSTGTMYPVTHKHTIENVYVQDIVVFAGYSFVPAFGHIAAMRVIATDQRDKIK